MSLDLTTDLTDNMETAETKKQTSVHRVSSIQSNRDTIFRRNRCEII